MLGFTTLSPTLQAFVLVAVVLVEAVVLYVGYGMLERVFAPPLLDLIEGH